MLQNIEARLEKLERSNRRLTVACIFFLLCLTVFFSAAAAQHSEKVVIEANEIRIKGTSGKASVLINSSGLVVSDPQTENILDAVSISTEGILLFGNKQMANLTVKGGPALELTDARGFKSTLGVTRLTVTRTGADETTSAASLVMFDEKGKVIWRQP
jgi:hypothetical protein